MASHEDRDHTLESLRRRADELTAEGGNRITAGLPGERPIAGAQQDGFAIQRLPDDPDGVLRISLGELDRRYRPGWPGPTRYLVFRGDTREIRRLLDSARAALDAAEL